VPGLLAGKPVVLSIVQYSIGIVKHCVVNVTGKVYTPCTPVWVAST
jgi:hypothetical protein